MFLKDMVVFASFLRFFVSELVFVRGILFFVVVLLLEVEDIKLNKDTGVESIFLDTEP